MLLLAAIFFGAAASAQPIGDMPIVNPKAGQPATCPATSRYEASRRGRTPKAQKLGELPDADAYLTMYRRIGRCEAPVIVKYGVSGR
jgi:hypothetical protein